MGNSAVPAPAARWRIHPVLFAVVAWVYSLAIPGAHASSESRVSESRFYSQSGREQQQPDRVSTDEFDTGLSIDKGMTRGSMQKASRDPESVSMNNDFWFYTADVELFADDDRDGYYHGIDLLFDVDTNYTFADVYAVVYLSLDGGPWIEYAETDDFTILGTSATDEYVIVTELLSGYPTGDYDLLIELFDSSNNFFLAEFGPADTSELSFLPLEDAERDLPVRAPAPSIAVSSGGGGAIDWIAFAVFGLVLIGSRGLSYWCRL